MRIRKYRQGWKVMSKQDIAEVYLKNFGPFKDAKVSARPLTVLIGKNSVGKSLMMQLIWALTISGPDFDKLAELASKEGASDLMEGVLEAAEKRGDVESVFKELVKLYIKVLPASIASSLDETLREVFAAPPGELVREGEENAIIGIKTQKALIEFKINDDVKVTRHIPYMEFLDKLKVKVPYPKTLKIDLPPRLIEYKLSTTTDILKALIDVLTAYVIDAYRLFLVEPLSMLLPDSRAGVSRILLKPYTSTRLLRGISFVDMHYRDSYFLLAEMLSNRRVDLNLLKSLLDELGCDVRVVEEGGVYNIRVSTWSGKELSLPRAPSGIREALTVALALTSHVIPLYVFIEEPEAHLHPRAQRVLVRLIAQAVNRLGKKVFISTHSDYILYTISNLVMLSGNPRIRELGFSEAEVLSPKNVAVYLIKPDLEKREAIVEELSVTNEGVPEEEFAKVAEELAEERARILA